MWDHVGVQVSDVEASAEYFQKVLAPLGISEGTRFPAPIGLVVGFGGTNGALQFWLSRLQADGREEVHIAFAAASRDQVRAVHDAVVAAGGEVLHPPQPHPEYHEHYYSVFFRDLDGNNVEAVCHVPATETPTD